MGRFPVRPKSEMEKKRLASVEAMARMEREKWDAEYQEICDRIYWEKGQCCAGCDHWLSDMGNAGRCTKAPPVSGGEVMKSLGFTFFSYTPAPGHPYTQIDDVCGEFKDDFDWSSLDQNYLIKIGAFWGGKLQPKPNSTPHKSERDDD